MRKLRKPELNYDPYQTQIMSQQIPVNRNPVINAQGIIFPTAEDLDPLSFEFVSNGITDTDFDDSSENSYTEEEEEWMAESIFPVSETSKKLGKLPDSRQPTQSLTLPDLHQKRPQMVLRRDVNVTRSHTVFRNQDEGKPPVYQKRATIPERMTKRRTRTITNRCNGGTVKRTAINRCCVL